MDTKPQLDNLEKHKLNLETAQISWPELQTHFARGYLISVNCDLDLVEVAFGFANDNRAQLESWLNAHHVHPVSDDQAREWHGGTATLWAVVVKPWVLVQARDLELH